MIIEKDVLVFIPLHGLHHDDKYFPEPDRYEPERFSDENNVNMTSCVYMPFGEGPRNCIGSNLLINFINLLFYLVLCRR